LYCGRKEKGSNLKITPANSTVEVQRYRWLILFVVVMSYIVVFLSRLSIGPLAPFLKPSLNLSNAEIGLLVTSTSIASAPALLASGWLVDRVGIRRMLIFGTFVGGFCFALLFFVPNYQFMVGIMVVSGVGFGCIFPAALKAIILWFPARERATAIGINQTGTNFGGIIAAGIMPTVASNWGWRYGFLVLGLIGLTICLSCFICYRDPQAPGLASKGSRESAAGGEKMSERGQTSQVLKSRDLWMLACSSLFLAVAEYSMITELVLYLNQELLFGVVAAGGMLALAEAAGAFAKPGLGLGSDRLLNGRRKIVLLGMALSACVIFLSLAFFGRALNWWIYPLVFILGFVAIGWGGLQATLIGELGGRSSAGTAAGFIASVLILGMMSGPPLFGYILDSTGSFRSAWAAMAVSCMISAVFIVFIREHKKKI
jgi:MFS transporter, ACS family, hexuronate transporter